MPEPAYRSIFEGDLVRLRAIEPEDWRAMHEGDLDTEVGRGGYEIRPRRSAPGMQEWVERNAREEPPGDDRFFIIETLEGGAVAGSISAHHTDRRNGRLWQGIALYRPHWRRGYGSEAIKLLLRYYFGELRYQKANAGVYAFNGPSLEIHRRLGFIEEGRVRRAVFTAGEYHDEVLFGITAEEFAACWPAFAPRLDDPRWIGDDQR